MLAGFDNKLTTTTRFLALNLLLPFRMLLYICPSSRLLMPIDKDLLLVVKVSWGLGDSLD
jgi:hypothetical protein